MKKCIFLLSTILFVFNATAQKIDSIYHLIDTVNTPKSARMWEFGTEGPFKFYTIACPCQQYGHKPTFVRRLDGKGKIINQNTFKALNIVDLPDLIQRVKNYTDDSREAKLTFFLVEPYKKEFIIYKVGFVQPRKPYVSDDHENISPDTVKKKP